MANINEIALKGKGNDNEKMIPHLEPDAPNTINFVKYLVSELLKREPLRHGKTIIIRTGEDSPYFPEFTDTLFEGVPYLKIDEGTEERGVFALSKLTAIYNYLLHKFKFHTTVLWPIGNNVFPLVLNIPMVINDPGGLYKMAEDLGVEINNQNNYLDNGPKYVPEFSENPPRITCGNKIIPIKYSSLQFYICREAFKQDIGQFISWDEVAESIDKSETKDDYIQKRSIYFAVRALNKRYRDNTKHDLFKWEEKSFCRIS